MPEAAFPNPLDVDVVDDAGRGPELGADRRSSESFTLGYARTHYGTGYYIYQQFPHGARNLSQPLERWDARRRRTPTCSS